MLFRMRAKIWGRHTHVAIFAGGGTLSLGKCGDLVFRNEEWTTFKENLFRFMEAGSDIEVIEEDTKHAPPACSEVDRPLHDAHMTKRTLNQILNEMYPNKADVPIWVWVTDDTYRLTTLGEYWGDIYTGREAEWKEIFDAPPA